jgi:hypothetical protein
MKDNGLIVCSTNKSFPWACLRWAPSTLQPAFSSLLLHKGHWYTVNIHLTAVMNTVNAEEFSRYLTGRFIQDVSDPELNVTTGSL